MSEQGLRAAIKKMFLVREELHAAFPKKPFTPDGRMIGDIGEAIAEICYKIIIDDKLRKDWDGTREGGNYKYLEVQIKATQKDGTYLKKPPHDGGLLVFKIFPDKKWKCYYNGSILRVWNYLNLQNPDNTGAKIISLDRLERLDKTINGDAKERIPLRKSVKS